jgi:hypothetical protein
MCDCGTCDACVLALFDNPSYDPEAPEIYEMESDGTYGKSYTVTFAKGEPPTCTCTAYAIGRNRAKSNKPVKTHGPQNAWCKHIDRAWELREVKA